MSLLLDALRRAAASKQGPETDQYVAPQRDDVILEPEAEVAREEDRAAAETPAGAAESPVDEPAEADTELSLELEADDDEAETPARPGPAPREPAGPSPPRAGPATRGAPRTAARTLLNARAGGRRRTRGILIVSLAVVATAALLAVGGWSYYQYSRDAAEQGLAAYQPTSDPLVEAPSAGEGDGLASAATEEPVEESEPNAATDQTPAGPVEEPEVATATASGHSGTGADNASATGEGAATEAADTETAPPAAEPDTAAAAAEPESTSRGDAAAGDAPSSAPVQPAKRQAQPLVTSSGSSVLETALNAGYDALRAGDLVTADREYSRALARDPDNRDGLLGLAGVAQRQGEPERAARYYRRVLEDNPRDPYARAGLASLIGQVDPRRSETEFKRLLQDQPDSPALHFALGNVYAGESRWSDAQQAYFKAYRAEPDNAEYAYNLAVALDHLQQRQAALNHYRAALEVLGGESIAAFSAEAIRRRIEQLE